MMTLIPRLARLAAAGAVAAALSATVASAPAHALALSIELRIFNTLAPTDPFFPNSSLRGAVQFTQVIPPPIFGDSFIHLPIGGPLAIDNVQPGDPYEPSDPYQPGDPYLPQLGGALAFSFTGTMESSLGHFPAFFLPPNPVVPATPPSDAPDIILGVLSNIGDTLSLSGPVYAWDDPFEVGTWEITITAVPEPASSLLLIGALGGLALTRRRRAGDNPLG